MNVSSKQSCAIILRKSNKMNYLLILFPIIIIAHYFTWVKTNYLFLRGEHTNNNQNNQDSISYSSQNVVFETLNMRKISLQLCQ